MIVVVIIGILLTVALPGFRDQMIRGNRAAAQAEMLDLANRQQQFFLANRSYADKDALLAGGYRLSSEIAEKYDFTVTVDNSAVPQFLITFTPLGRQAVDGPLSLDNRGEKTPADKWD